MDVSKSLKSAFENIIIPKFDILDSVKVTPYFLDYDYYYYITFYVKKDSNPVLYKSTRNEIFRQIIFLLKMLGINENDCKVTITYKI